MTTNERALEFRILGAVEARRDGVALPLGGARQRALLGLLLISPGQATSADRLIDELWAGEPPDGADVTLRSYASRLRAALEPGVELNRTSAGYRLAVAPEQVDATRFEALVREGEAALDRRAVRRAAGQLREALDLWAGQPFGELAEAGALLGEAERLEEVRLRALEARIDADLQLGRAADLVDELETLVREHPYRERLWRHLMLALYRAGRQAGALDAYGRARRILDEQLGLEPGPELERLQLAILNHDVPLPTPPDDRHNLPAPLTSFIGRGRELEELSILLGGGRLLTLTGVGGVGKTRLALETARRAVPDYPDGVFFVDLSPVTESARIPHQVAAVLDVQEMPEQTLLDLLGGRVRDRELLLVLDNCEHVREGAADVAFRLLASAPRLRILATSREVLGVPGETDYAVPPLGLGASAGDPATSGSSEAVDLFMARARAVNPALRDDSASLGDASMIVTTLDGLPLAIELAAARAKALSLPDIAARLTDRFRFLVSWRRITSARHRTLREAMDWSYELLGANEQSLLARLSVFTGGFTVAAVSAVCLDGDEDGALRQTERLVDASLVVPVVSGVETRYRLLETVRQYAAERVAELGVDADDRRRHADFYLGLALSANLGVDIEGEQRFDVVFAEQDNFHAALDWALEAGEIELGLRLAVALHDHWVTGRAAEGMRRLRAFLDAGGDVPSDLHARALLAIGLMSVMSGAQRGTAIYQQALVEFDAIGDTSGRAHALDRMAFDATGLGRLDRARALAEESLTLHRQVGGRRGEAQALGALARVEWLEGRRERAIELGVDSVAAAAEGGYWWWQLLMLSNLAEYALDADDPIDAERYARDTIRLARRLSDRQSVAFMLAVLARLAAEDGRLERSGLLWGALEAEEQRGPIGMWETQRADYAAKIPAFGDPTFEAARASGRRLTLAAAMALAVDEDSGATPASR